MDKKRKETIIKEIRYWKQSKLLPEQYCNFLLTLYTEGAEEPGSRKESSSLLTFLVSFVIFLFIVLVIYFTEFSIAMQMAIGIVFTIIIVLLAFRMKERVLSCLSFLLAAVLLYMLTIKIVLNVFSEPSFYVMLFTILHCAAWFIIGWVKRIHFFTIASVLGILVLLFFIL
ncbi:hypothetical protein GN156_16640 [bacterium LRH843]|nr:hypothetical protein [bacterium LRH843]